MISLSEVQSLVGYACPIPINLDPPTGLEPVYTCFEGRTVSFPVTESWCVTPDLNWALNVGNVSCYH